jgi:putative ABC transport system permease protein
MQISDPAIYGLKTVIADRKRFFWVIIGLTLGIGLYVAINILADGYTKLVALPFSQLNTDLIIQRALKGKQAIQKSGQPGIRLPFSNQAISKEEVQGLQNLDSIENLSMAMMLWYQEKNIFSIIAGVEPEDSTGPAAVMSWIDKGRKLINPGEVVVESHYAKFNKIIINSQIFLGHHSFKVVGIAKIKQGASVAAANYYISLSDARELAWVANTTNTANSANMLFVRMKKGSSSEEIQQKLSEIIPGAFTSTADNIGSMLKGFAKISNTVSRLLSFVAIGFVMLLSFWLITGAINERSWQVGLMRSVGWQKKDILTAIISETMLLGCIGGICGLGLGYLISYGLSFQEISLALPWNLSVQPGTVGQNSSNAGPGLVAIPVIIKIETLFIALGIAIFSTIMTGIFITGKLINNRV